MIVTADRSFFGRDQRSRSLTLGQTLVRIRPLISRKNVNEYPVPVTFDWPLDQLLLIEDADQDVLSEHVLARRFDVAICRNDQVRSTTPVLIRQILNVTRGDLRLINLSSPIRAELELEVFGREYLISQLIKGVQSYPLVIFIDDFGLYRTVPSLVSMPCQQACPPRNVKRVLMFTPLLLARTDPSLTM